MEPERDEVYERIPWETLEKQGGDRQWLVYAIAGAVVLGALAYSLARNHPASPQVLAAPVTSSVPATTVPLISESPPSTVASPIVVAEADLFAIDPERLIDQAAAHAEWFTLEYMSVDGSGESRDVLSRLLPSGVPLPQAPEGTQVFVDWVRAIGAEQTGPTEFQVDVLVRSLVSHDESGFTRRAPELVSVKVLIGDDGFASVAMAPSIALYRASNPVALSLVDVPDEVAREVGGEVVGGSQNADGMWGVVTLVEDSAGVKRPVSVVP